MSRRHILTPNLLAFILSALSPTLVTAGIETPNNGHNRPLSTVAFLYPQKTQAALRLCLSVMVGCIGQPLKRLAGSVTGSLNPIQSATQRLRPKGGGYYPYNGVTAMNTLQAKSVQNSGQIQTNQYINYIQHIADEPERFDVTYFFVCDDHFYENWIYNNKLSFSENWISNTKISTCFSTLEVARKVQARLKKKYPDCTVKCMTRFFNEEHDPERLTLLAIINDDDPERFYVTCFYLQIDLSIEDEGFSGTVLSFATEEQAMAAGEIALKYHSQCGIQEMTYFFYGEDGEGRKSVLASRIDDSLDNIRSNLSAYFEAEKAQSEVCNDL